MFSIWSWKESRVTCLPLIRAICIIAISSLAVACSGGGGGGSDAPVNLAPAITANCTTTPQYDKTVMTVPRPLATVNGTLMATDADPITFSLDVNNPMIAGPVTTANGGMVVLNDVTTGAYTYTAPAEGAVPGQSPRGRDSFQFRVDDPSTFSVGTETIIVNPNILPLGDSITQGTGDPMVTPNDDAHSYRLQLLNRLNMAGYQVDYVGLIDSGVNFLPTQFSHGGYPSFRPNEIADGAGMGGAPARPAPFNEYSGIFDELNKLQTQAQFIAIPPMPATYSAGVDIILLHIGTNPVSAINPSGAATESILNEVDRWEDSANGYPISMAVMQIINQCITVADSCAMGGGAQEANIIALNADVISRIGLADPLNLPDQVISGAGVDMFTASGGMTPDVNFFADDFHPSTAGYADMGDLLFTALTGPGGPAILETCP